MWIVWYPASRSTPGQVGRPVSRRLNVSPSKFVMVRCCAGHCPVSMEQRAGMQIGVGVKACVKLAPSAASRSIVGVCTSGCPLTQTQSKRCWSL